MKSGSGALLRERNVVRGVLGGAVARSASLVAPFLVMPELLRFLGEARFGVWMTVVSLTSMAAFTDFGIGNGLLTQLAQAYGSQDYRQMRAVITSAYFMLGIISVMMLACIGGMAALVEAGLVVVPYLPLDHESRSIIWVTISAFALGVSLSAIYRILLACQKHILANSLQIVSSLFSVVACLLAIRLGLKTWAVVTVYAFAPVVCSAIGTIVIFAWTRELRPGRAALSRQRALNLLALGSNFFLLSIITSIALNLDNLLIASRLGTSAVTEFAIPAKLASLLGLMVTTFFLPLWAANGEALQRRDFQWIKHHTRRMVIFGAMAVGVAGCMMAFGGGAAAKLWMGRDFINTREILAMFALFYFIVSIASPYHMLLNSAGKVKIQILAWAGFLIVSASAKYWALMVAGSIWIVPLVSAIAFTVCVLPIVVLSGRRIYTNV